MSLTPLGGNGQEDKERKEFSKEEAVGTSQLFSETDGIRINIRYK